jgi:small-conductance mechanosensitive channel
MLLFENTARVGEIVEVDGHVARVLKIGLRTTEIETRDRIKLIVPNSKFISDTVINWSNNKTATRFSVKFRVRYGSDVNLIKKITLASLENNPQVEKNPAPQLIIENFGENGLEFDLLFYSNDLFKIEFVKSNVRYDLEKAFMENNIKFGFQQMDLHVKQLP